MLRLLLLLALLASGPAAGQVRLLGLTAEGGDFRAELSDGRVLHGAGLVGAVLELDSTELRIEAARRDEGVPGARPNAPAEDVWLFRLSLRSRGGDWAEACNADPQGERLGMVYPGEDGGLRLTCSSGAIGKCIRFGYRPWAATAGGVPLAPYHAACVNMVRAAYGGPERAWTRDGMRIDIYDRIGIQHPANEPDAAFEAGWTPAGAVCVAHVRVPENGSLADVAAAVPALAGRTGAGCTEERAVALGALVLNRSVPH